MLDIHTHILFGTDDGSKTLRRSIAMLRAEARQGVERVVLTPHFYAHRESPGQFLKRRNAALQALKKETDALNGVPEIMVGAEVAFFRGISRAENIEALCIEGTRAMLIEMPFAKWNGSMTEELLYLKECRGIRPILAHIERYLRFQPPGTIGQMCAAGIWMQANASFFLKWQTALPALYMLKKRRIHFVGSDCHDTKVRPPNFGRAAARIEKRLGKRTLQYLGHMERRLLKGE